MLFQEIYIKQNNIRMENGLPGNCLQKKAYIVTLISDETEFKAKELARTKKSVSCLIKVQVTRHKSL